MKLSAVLVFAAWLLIVLNVDPGETAVFGKLLFYGSSFLLLSAVFILFFTWMRKRSGADGEISFGYLGISFRQGVLLAFLVIVLLFLQSMRLLVWWDGALVVVSIFLIELYFLTRR